MVDTKIIWNCYTGLEYNYNNTQTQVNPTTVKGNKLSKNFTWLNKERQTDRQTDRDRQTETDRQAETERDRDRQTDRQMISMSAVILLTKRVHGWIVSAEGQRRKTSNSFCRDVLKLHKWFPFKSQRRLAETTSRSANFGCSCGL